MIDNNKKIKPKVLLYNHVRSTLGTHCVFFIVKLIIVKICTGPFIFF